MLPDMLGSFKVAPAMVGKLTSPLQQVGFTRDD